MKTVELQSLRYRGLLSIWTAVAMSVLCVVVAITLDEAVDDHVKAMSQNCGELVRMPTWCRLGYFIVMALAGVTIVLGFVAPALRTTCGEITRRDAVVHTAVRVVVASVVTLYVVHSYHAAPSAPFHVPCF